MSAGWSQVRTWRSEGLEYASEDLLAMKKQLLGLGEDLDRSDPRSWTGMAAEAARTELMLLRELLEDRVTEVAAVERAVNEAGDAVTGVMRAVEQVEDFAHANGLSIGASAVAELPGQVMGPVVRDVRGQTQSFRTQHDADLATAERRGLVAECVTRIDQVMRKANEVDADLCRVLRDGVLNGRLLAMTATDLAAAAAAGDAFGQDGLFAPPAGAGTPAQNAGWWASLSDSEREQVISAHPGWIGNRDGIDFASRDKANRNLLPGARAQLEAQLAQLAHEETRLGVVPPHGYDTSKSPEENQARQTREEMQWRAATANLQARTQVLADKLASVATLETIAGLPDRQILGLDLSNTRAQAIIAVGNVDTADHVAVFTPGLTSTVQGIDGYEKNMEHLQQKTLANLDRHHSDDTVAAVAWLDYQAPQFATTFTPNSFGSPQTAEHGGRDLAEFYRGLGATRTTDADVTVLGHSYGSTTTGYALREQTGVDRAAFFGSPGTSVNHIEDLQVPTDRSSYAEAKWDGVGDIHSLGIHSFGQDVTALEGLHQMETEAATTVTPGGLSVSLDGVTGHTSYLNENTTSQHNLAAMVAGHQEDVIYGNTRGITDPKPQR